jgi:hypothetical protein
MAMIYELGILTIHERVVDAYMQRSRTNPFAAGLRVTFELISTSA